MRAAPVVQVLQDLFCVLLRVLVYLWSLLNARDSGPVLSFWVVSRLPCKGGPARTSHNVFVITSSYIDRFSPVNLQRSNHSRSRHPLGQVHTADADATQLSSWVASAVCAEFATSWRQYRQVWTNLLTAKSSCIVSAVWTHQSAVVTQLTISCAVELLRLVISDDITTSLLKKLSISMKIHVVKPLWSLFGQFPNCRPNPSAVVVS